MSSICNTYHLHDCNGSYMPSICNTYHLPGTYLTVMGPTCPLYATHTTYMTVMGPTCLLYVNYHSHFNWHVIFHLTSHYFCPTRFVWIISISFQLTCYYLPFDITLFMSNMFVCELSLSHFNWHVIIHLTSHYFCPTRFVWIISVSFQLTCLYYLPFDITLYLFKCMVVIFSNYIWKIFNDICYITYVVICQNIASNYLVPKGGSKMVMSKVAKQYLML